MRPMFTVHAGEFLVGQYIEGKLKKNVWLPTKDVGVDLLGHECREHKVTDGAGEVLSRISFR